MILTTLVIQFSSNMRLRRQMHEMKEGLQNLKEARKHSMISDHPLLLPPSPAMTLKPTGGNSGRRMEDEYDQKRTSARKQNVQQQQPDVWNFPANANPPSPLAHHTHDISVMRRPRKLTGVSPQTTPPADMPRLSFVSRPTVVPSLRAMGGQGEFTAPEHAIIDHPLYRVTWLPC